MVAEGHCDSLFILTNVLDEATLIGQDSLYPSEELEWLATTTFNLAIDLYVAEKDDAGKELAVCSLRFAHAMQDKRLIEMIQAKMLRLGWRPE